MRQWRGGEKTVEVDEVQDMCEAVDSKMNITVLLKGDITVTDSAPRYDGLLNDAAEAQGGAVYLKENSRLHISNNTGDVSFLNNEVRASVSQEDEVATDAGGAIWGAASSHIEISGNRRVNFCGNVASTGSAIYTQGTLSIRNNQYVIFGENSGPHAVYLSGSESQLQLSAAKGDTIRFDDSIYVEGSAELNADYGERCPGCRN